MSSGSENTKELERIDKNIPFLLKAAALLLIVYGIIGFAYYVTVVVYSMLNNDFLSHLEYNKFHGNYLYIPLIIDLLILFGIILSGFLLIYRKKRGAYYFYLFYFFTIGYSAFILNQLNLLEIITGSIILIIILIHRNKLQ